MRVPDTDHREGSRIAHAGTPIFRGRTDRLTCVYCFSFRLFSEGTGHIYFFEKDGKMKSSFVCMYENQGMSLFKARVYLRTHATGFNEACDARI